MAMTPFAPYPHSPQRSRQPPPAPSSALNKRKGIRGMYTLSKNGGHRPEPRLRFCTTGNRPEVDQRRQVHAVRHGAALSSLQSGGGPEGARGRTISRRTRGAACNRRLAARGSGGGACRLQECRPGRGRGTTRNPEPFHVACSLALPFSGPAPAGRSQVLRRQQVSPTSLLDAGAAEPACWYV